METSSFVKSSLTLSNNTSNVGKEIGTFDLEKVMYNCQGLLQTYNDKIEPILIQVNQQISIKFKDDFIYNNNNNNNNNDEEEEEEEDYYNNDNDKNKDNNNNNNNKTLPEIMRSYINEWQKIVGVIQTKALQLRNASNRAYVKNQTLEEEVKERDRIIQLNKEEMEHLKNNYELQLKGMENLLMEHNMKSFSSQTSNTHNNNNNKHSGMMMSSQDVERVRRELDEHLRKYQQQQIENEKLQQTLQILQMETTSEMQQLLIDANEQVARKDDELLRLRWIVEDLELDKAALEDELRKIKNNSSFISEKAQQYTVDLSKFVKDDDNKDDVRSMNKNKEGKTTNGNHMLVANETPEEQNDTEISPLVKEKIKQALEAAQKMTKKISAAANNSSDNNSSNNQPSNSPNKSRKDVSNLSHTTAYPNQEESANQKSATEILLPLLKTFTNRWISHKAQIQKIRHGLQQSQDQCKVIKKRLNPLLEADALSELPSHKLSTLLSLIHLVEDSTTDISMSTNDGNLELEEVEQFVDDILTTLTTKSEATESSPINANKVLRLSSSRRSSLPIKVAGYIQGLQAHTSGNHSRMTNLSRGERLQSEIDVLGLPEEHMKRREQYAGIIGELEEYLKEAQRQCSQISGMLRTVHSKLSKSNDQNEWMSMMSNINNNTNDALSLIFEVLEGSLNEIKTAGTLLMDNDKQIEGFEEQLNALATTLVETRKEYHQKVQEMSEKVRKLRDRKAKLQEQLAQERTIIEKKSSEQARLEELTTSLQSKLEQQLNESSPEEVTKYVKSVEQIANEMTDLEKATEITDALEFFQKLSRELSKMTEMEKKWRFKYSEVSRQLEEMQMRRKYERSHLKKKQDQLQNAFYHEKDLMEDKHNALMERLQDELQMFKTSAVRSSKFDVESRLEQLEEALTESHIQIRDKDEEIRDMTETLDSMAFQISELEQENSRLRVMSAGVKQDTIQGSTTDKAFEMGTDFVPELRKCYEIIDNLVSSIEPNPSTRRSSDAERQPTAQKEEDSRAFDITECKVLLNELSRELEMLGGMLTEKDQAIETLSNRLKINQYSHSIMEKKLHKIYTKFLEFGGTKEEIDTPLSDMAMDEEAFSDENNLKSTASNERRQNHTQEPSYEDKSWATSRPSDIIQKEQRKHGSAPRRSSVTSLDMRYLKSEANKIRQEMREVKSDFAARSNEPATQQDIVSVKNLPLPNPIIRRKEIDETQLQSHSYNTSNASHEPTASVTSASYNPDDNTKKYLTAEEKTMLPAHRDSKITIAELQSMYEDKAQLVEDLQKHVDALQQSRLTEVKTLREGLRRMVERCRRWWDKMLHQYGYLESEFKKKMIEMNNIATQSNTEEQKQKLMLAHNELEKLKSKFSLEEKNLRDTLDTKNQEIERLTNRVKDLEVEKAQSIERLDNRNESDLREEIDQLKEMLAEQEKGFVDEVDQFETLANQKLQELEKFYRAQILQLTTAPGNDHYTEEQLINITSNHKEIYEQVKLSLAQAREQTFNVLRSNNLHTLGDSNKSATGNNTGNHNNVDPKNIINNDINNNNNVAQNNTKLSATEHDNLEKIKQLEMENTLLKQGNEDLTNKLSNFHKGFSDNKDKFQQKIQRYEHIYQDLAQKLKDSHKTCDELYKKIDKSHKSILKHKQKKRKLKEDLKQVQAQVENLQAVQADILDAKQSLRSAQQERDAMKEQFESIIKKLENDAENLRKSKIEYVQQTMMEINNLRDYVKQLQRQIKQLKQNGETEQPATTGTTMRDFVSLFGK